MHSIPGRSRIGCAAARGASCQKPRHRRSDMQSMRWMQWMPRFCTLAVAAVGLLFMPLANAQDKKPSAPAPGATTAPAAPAAPTTISEKKLDAAAAAVKQTTTLKGTYDQKLAKATPAEKPRIAGEADQAMRKAVTDQGLSVEEYMSILKVAQDDPVVRDKLLQRLK